MNIVLKYVVLRVGRRNVMNIELVCVQVITGINVKKLVSLKHGVRAINQT